MNISNPDSSSLVFKLYEVVDSENWNEFHDIFDENVVYKRPGYPRFNGLDELINYYKNDRIISRGKHEIINLVSADNKIVVYGLFKGNSKTGEELELEYSDYFELCENKLNYRKTYFHTPLV